MRGRIRKMRCHLSWKQQKIENDWNYFSFFVLYEAVMYFVRLFVRKVAVDHLKWTIFEIVYIMYLGGSQKNVMLLAYIRIKE